MRILVCTPHVPFPPRGGGRADIWRRIEAFTALGHDVMLLHQHEPAGPLAPTAEQFAQMDEILAARSSYPLRRHPLRTLAQLAGMARLPWRVAKAEPTLEDRTRVEREVRAFAPDVVWLDGPWLGRMARQIRAETGARIAYRSHNIEHVYLLRQARAAKRLRHRIAWRLATIGLRRYELDLMRESALVLDISLEDLAFWQSQGVERIGWLPPLPELALTEPPEHHVPSDLLFVGGLRYPNNVHGVRWLVDEVMPLVLAERPDLRLSVVGSSPLEDLRRELETHPSVSTHFDVDSVNPHLFGARVLVNPVSIGSGVQLKMLDMLMTDAPIVTRSLGVRGLPPECVAEFTVADEAPAFARAILDHLETSTVDLTTRAAAREFFTVSAVRRALEPIADGQPSA